MCNILRPFTSLLFVQVVYLTGWPPVYWTLLFPVNFYPVNPVKFFFLSFCMSDTCIRHISIPFEKHYPYKDTQSLIFSTAQHYLWHISHPCQQFTPQNCPLTSSIWIKQNIQICQWSCWDLSLSTLISDYILSNVFPCYIYLFIVHTVCPCPTLSQICLNTAAIVNIEYVNWISKSLLIYCIIE